MEKLFHPISKFVLSAIILMALVAAVRAEAATVSLATDAMTRLQTSQTANHEVLITTPTGVLEGQTVTLTFDSGFTTSSILEDDVDVADNGTELTTATSCAGTDKASVTIASNTITITICAGDGGAMTAGHTMRVRIGTNATNSGTGTNQITNPSTAANHFLTIGGTFGDAGTIVLAIRSASDAVSVSASIPSVGGGGGGTNSDNTGDLTQTDSVAPTISNVIVSGVTATDATIGWTTNEDATSKVTYGLTSALELGFILDTTLSKNHAVSLSGLKSGKNYFFQIKSADQSNNVATSQTQTFSTVDTIAPVISSISITNITKTGATVNWMTDELSTSVLEYGATQGYGASKTLETLSTNHAIVLTGLRTASTFHFRVSSKDASANTSVSNDQTFQTLPDLAPANVSGLSIVRENNQMILSWKNPTEDDLIGVRVLQCAGAYPKDQNDADCTTVHDDEVIESITIDDPSTKNTYYFGVFAKDAALQFASGALVLGKPSTPEIELPKDACEGALCPPKTVSEAVCGDQHCSGNETATSCSADCSVQTINPVVGTGAGSVCGNGICEAEESAFVCPSDCKTVSVTKTPGSGVSSENLSFSDVSIHVAGGTIELREANGVFDVLPHTALQVRVKANAFQSGVLRASLLIGSESYLLRALSADQTAPSYTAASLDLAAQSSAIVLYGADVFAPSSVSQNPITLFVEYVNGQSVTVSSFLRVVAPGATHEIIDGEETAISGVRVRLSQQIGSVSTVWDGSPFGEANPTMSQTDGSFAWYVPNGLYFVRAEHDEYQTFDTPVFDVSNHIVNPRIFLTSLVKPEIEPVKTATEAVLSVQAVKDAAKTIATSIQQIRESKPVKVLSEGLETVRANPVVQQAADVSVPTLAVSAGTSVVVMSVAFDFLPFVQYLFTAPVLLLWRKKRKAFGVIYNTISKEPIGLAVVRLYQVKDEQERLGKLVRSRVTDKGGRFYFLVQPGLYRLSVTKTGFSFPSSFLREKKEDVQYIDLYHGELLRVSDADAVISPNIPLDPSDSAKFHEPGSIKWQTRLRVIQHTIAILGVLASLVILVIRPNVLAAAMAGIQIGVYFFVQRLARPRKPKSWGIVYDKKTSRPLANVIARIFEPKYNKLLETQVTDSHGRYSFLLGPAEYYAVFEKEGYRSTQVRPIDYSKDTEAKDFSMDIHLFERDSVETKT